MHAIQSHNATPLTTTNTNTQGQPAAAQNLHESALMRGITNTDVLNNLGTHASGDMHVVLS